MNRAARVVTAIAVGVALGAAASISNRFESPATFLLNAGWAWAALPVAVGWIVGFVKLAVFAAPLAGFSAVLAYYLSDSILGGTPLSFYATDIVVWLIAFAVIGSAMGFVGVRARRPGLVGSLAALIVPLGASIEMIWLPRWPAFAERSWSLGAAQVIVWVGSAVVFIVVIWRLRTEQRSSWCDDATISIGRGF